MPYRGRSSPLRALALACLAIALASACGAPRDPYAGSYVVKGGGTPLAVFRALSGEFGRRHPGVQFDFEDIGSAPTQIFQDKFSGIPRHLHMGAYDRVC